MNRLFVRIPYLSKYGWVMRKYSLGNPSVMTEDRSEEFRKFILENREIIESILKEADGEDVPDKEKDPVKAKVDETKGKVKDVSDALLTVISNEDVQKHFITGCLEFLHFFEAVINAAPLSPEVREAVDRLEQTRDTTIQNIVAVGAKDRMENITVNDVKERPSDKASDNKEKFESISIRDVKNEGVANGKE